MTTAIKTKYRQGVFEPLEAITLPEGAYAIVYPKTKTTPSEDETWLNATAEDLANRLTALEAELPQSTVTKWHKAMSRAAKPARYIEGKGVVLEQEA